MPDDKIIRKKFIDSPESECGYLHEVVVNECDVVPIAPRAEIRACQLITFEKPVGITKEKKETLKMLARAFWTNDIKYRGRIQDYLSPCGAVVEEVLKINRDEAFPDD